VHDLGLDVSAWCLEDELEDLVQGGAVSRVDALTQAVKLDAQVLVGSASTSLRPSS
jgi:hypothetical protein